jgi:predicted  nucleic acid-binding Zn-ribbon protein
MTTGPTRIEQLEALAQTILLSIDQLRLRQEEFREDLQASREEFDRRLNANAEQIAANTAGMIELRGLLADYLRSRTDVERRSQQS